MISLNSAAFKKLYHVSAEAGIQRLRGRWSPKIMRKGIFVTSEKNAIYRSWAGYVSGKKFPRDERPSKGKSWYDNLTLYTLAVPNGLYKKIERVIPRAMDHYEEMGRELSLGAWGWDTEDFIPEEYLDQIKIIGRENLTTGEFFKRDKARGLLDPTKPLKGPVRRSRENLSSFLADVLLGSPSVSPLVVRYLKEKAFSLFNRKTRELTGENVPDPRYPEYANTVWREKMVLSPSEKKVLLEAEKEARELILQILRTSEEEVEQERLRHEKEVLVQQRDAWKRNRAQNDRAINWRGVSLNA